MDEHHCHALGCKRPCPPAWLMCRACWKRVPAVATWSANYAREAARVAGLEWSRWVERAVRQTMARESIERRLSRIERAAWDVLEADIFIRRTTPSTPMSACAAAGAAMADALDELRKAVGK